MIVGGGGDALTAEIVPLSDIFDCTLFWRSVDGFVSARAMPRIYVALCLFGQLKSHGAIPSIASVFLNPCPTFHGVAYTARCIW